MKALSTLLKAARHACSTKTIFLCLLASTSFRPVQAQVVFTSGAGLTQTQNFDGMSGLAMTSGFTLTAAGGSTSVDASATSLNGTSGGKSYKFSSGSDHSVGFLNSGSFSSPRSITAELKNNTGSVISSLTINFNYEKYRSGSRAWSFTFLGGPSLTSLTAQPAGNHSYPADANNTVITFPPLSTSKTVTISGLNIADGASYYLRWTLTGSGGSTNGQALAIDDFSATATLLAPSCTAPTGLAANNIAGSTADLSWNTVPGATGYEYAVDQTVASPAGPGTPTTGTAYNATGLSGSSTYYLHVRTHCGGSSYSSWATIPFVTPCAPPVAIITAAGPLAFCAGGQVTLNAANGVGLSHQWQLDGSNIPGATGSSISATTAGTYTVISSNAPGCADTSAGTVVTVHSAPNAVASAGGPLAFCSGGNVSLNATGGGNYQWLLNGTAIAAAINATYTTTASGNYSVIVTNSNNCTDTSAALTVNVHALPVPVITATGSTTFCEGGQAVLDANSGTGWTYQWQLNGTDIAGATSDTLATGIGAAYTVIVTDGNACSDTSNTINITVHTNPAISVTAGGPLTFCDGGFVLLDAGTASGLSYQWYNGSSSISGAANALYTATTSGTYSVIATDANTCTDTSAPVAVTVHPLPAALISASGPLTFCSGGNVQLSANTGPGLAYQWIQNSAPVSGATGINHTATSSGTFEVIVTDGNSCTDTSTGTIVTVNPTPSAAVAVSGPLDFCPGGNVTLSNNSGAGYNYQWQENNANISATSSSYTANAAGSYRLIVSGGNGCADTSATMTVTVHPDPVATSVAAGATTVCQGTPAVLNATTPGTGLTYQWLLNGNPITGAVSASYGAAAPGQYEVVVYNSFNCADTALPISIMVNPTPAAVITYNAPLAFCEGSAVVLTGNQAGGITYQWLRNGTVIGGATSSFYSAAQTGEYMLHTTNSFGCVGKSDTVDVTVYAKPQPAIIVNGFELIVGSYAAYQWYRDGFPIPGATSFSYTVTVNGAYSVEVTDANGCTNRSAVTFINTVGVSQVPAQHGIRIFPNPVSGLLYIDAPADAAVTVVDAAGRVLYKGKNTTSVDLSGRADGLYFIIVEGADGAWTVREKVLKQSH